MTRITRLDARFWAILLVGLFSVGMLGCFGFAAASRSSSDADILNTDNFPPPSDL